MDPPPGQPTAARLVAAARALAASGARADAGEQVARLAFARMAAAIGQAPADVTQHTRWLGAHDPGGPAEASPGDPALQPALDAVDWGGVMADALGPALLLGTLQTAVDPPARGAGAHYTPPALARRLVGEALEALGRVPSSVLDPACGAGIFLAAAVERLADERDPAALVEHVVAGVDRDPRAVRHARRVLWLAAGGRLSAPQVAARVRLADALAGPLPPVDLILGNPPYVDNKRIPKADKVALKAAGLRWLHGLWDLSVPFVERALAALRPGGVLGLVLPNKLATRDYGERLRRGLAIETTLVMLDDVSEHDLFGGASVFPILLVARRTAPPVGHRVRVHASGRDDAEPTWLGQDRLAAMPRGIWPLSIEGETVERVLEAVEGREVRRLGADLGTRLYRPLGFDWRRWMGAVAPARPAGGEALRFVGCGSIAPLRIDWHRPLRMQGRRFEGAWLRRPEAVDAARWALLGRPALLVRELARELTAAADLDGAYGHLTGIYAFVDLDDELPLEVVVGLLNSRLLRSFFSGLFWNTHLRGGYLDVKGSYLELLPLRPPSRARRQRVQERVQRLTADPTDRHGWAALDAEVNRLYGLPADWEPPRVERA